MRTRIKNLTVILLTLITIFTWGLVIRQEIKRRRLPQSLPPGGSITLPAPGSGPTEETPVIEIFATITDAETGQPVVADVQAGPASRRGELVEPSGRGQVSLSQVSEFRIIFPATDETIAIRVTAPGYQEWAVELKPHVVRSKRMEITVELKPKPTGDQTYRISNCGLGISNLTLRLVHLANGGEMDDLLSHSVSSMPRSTTQIRNPKLKP